MLTLTTDYVTLLTVYVYIFIIEASLITIFLLFSPPLPDNWLARCDVFDISSSSEADSVASST